MEDQLALIPAERPWRLDEKTREIGRRGVAEARAVLRRTGTAPEPDARAA